MSVHTKWPLMLFMIVGLVFASAEISTATTGGISLSTPSSVTEGNTFTGTVTSDSDGIRVVVTDSLGNVIFDSDENPGAGGSPSNTGVYSMTFDCFVPMGTPGPLNVTATNATGGSTSNSVNVN